MQLHITCCSFPLKLYIYAKSLCQYNAYTEGDEIVVLLCLNAIALAMQHLNGPRIIRSCWSRRWIQRSNVYGANHALLEELRNEDPKSLKKHLQELREN